MVAGLSGNVLADLNDGLVAYYPFNGDAKDASGNGNDGTVNGATLIEDRFGKKESAYNFDGKSYIDLGSNIHDKFFTVAAWVKPSLITSGRHSIVSSRESNNSTGKINEGFVLALPEGTNGKARIWIKTGTWKYIDDGMILKNDWYFLLASFDGSVLKLFRNGVLVAENNITGTLNTSPEHTVIGARASFDKYFFNGKIDDVRIYNRALSESEIQQLYKPIKDEKPPIEISSKATYYSKNKTLYLESILVPFIDEFSGEETDIKGIFDAELKEKNRFEFELIPSSITFNQMFEGE